MKLRLSIVAVALGLLALPVTVDAQASSAASPVLSTAGTAFTLNPAVGPPTLSVKAKGAGYRPGEVVGLYFDGTRIGSDLVNPSGKFNTGFTVPASARPGDHVVEAVGQASGVTGRAAFRVRTDWLQGCFDGGRSCVNRYENVLDRATASGLALAWRAPVGTDGSTSPVYANGEVFVGTSDGLVGLDPATGAIIINYRTGPVTTTPAVIKGFDPQPDPPGKVLFGSADGILHAVSTDGRALWQVGVGGRLTSPLVIQYDGPDAKVIVGAGDTLFALDGDGHRQWAAVLEGGDISTPPALLAVRGTSDRVIVAAGNTLHALDAATGAIVWATAPSRSRLGAPSIGDLHIIGDPHLLVGDQDGSLFSLDPTSGRVVATFAARGPIVASPAIGDPNQADPWVVLGDGGGNIYAFDTTDEFPPPIWQAALGGPVDGPPVLAHGVVYAVTDPDIGDPSIFALDQATGRVLFQGALPGRAASQPVIADGRVVVATASGAVVAYEGPDS